FFFFSSRRRHTRSDRDWSSDVCSSDLDQVDRFTRRFMLDYVEGYLAGGNARLAVYQDGEQPIAVAQEVSSLVDSVPALADLFPRSEERRVGKECGCGGARDQ